MNVTSNMTESQRMALDIMAELKKPPPKKPRVAEEIMATIYPVVKEARQAEWNWKEILALVRRKGLKISATRLKKLYEQCEAKGPAAVLASANKIVTAGGAP